MIPAQWALARGSSEHSDRGGPMRTLSWVAVVPCALLLAGASAARVHGGPDACRMTAAAVLRSCRTGARADHQLALAKCDNQPDRASRRKCTGQAAADVKDALASCSDERKVRQGACARLGAAPYHPTIDPANFVATIDNP